MTEEREKGRDLSLHIEFLKDVIAVVHQTDSCFGVYTDGPWYCPWYPRSTRTYDANTGGYPWRGYVGNGEIYIVFQPKVVNWTKIDLEYDSGEPLELVLKQQAQFLEAPCLYLHKVHQLAGESWHQAWEMTESRWRRRGLKIPDFADFLEED